MPVTRDRYTFHLACSAPGCDAQALCATQYHEDPEMAAKAAERVARAAQAAWSRGWRWIPGGDEAWCPQHANGRQP